MNIVRVLTSDNRTIIKNVDLWSTLFFLVTLLTTYVEYCVFVLYFKFFDEAKNYLS